MQQTSSLLTLPGLQSRLDQLRPGEVLTLAISDCQRLFGLNDIAQERMDNFAAGHLCVLSATPSALTFRKTASRPPI